MARLEQRLARLEKETTINPLAGKHSLQINVNSGERCDEALTRALKDKGISLKDVVSFSIIADIHARPLRDLQNHPEWELLKKLFETQNIWTLVIVQDKAEWEEYQEHERTMEGVPFHKD